MRQILYLECRDDAQIMAACGGMLDSCGHHNKTKLHQAWLAAEECTYRQE